jgi:hypothetical protein
VSRGTLRHHPLIRVKPAAAHYLGQTSAVDRSEDARLAEAQLRQPAGPLSVLYRNRRERPFRGLITIAD